MKNTKKDLLTKDDSKIELSKVVIDVLSQDDLKDLEKEVSLTSKDLTNEDGSFKEVDSLKEVKRTDSKNGDEFFPSFEDLITTGRIGEDNYIFFDYNRDKFVHINKSTDQREVLSTMAASHKLFETFFSYGVELKNPTSDLKYVRKVRVEFDLLKEEEWESGLGKHFNEFQIGKTMLPFIDRLREENKDNLTTDLKELKENSPFIYSLLLNLHEDTEEGVLHFINWLSTFVNTRKKVPTAFLYAGVEGAGKGVLVEIILAKIFGTSYVTSQMASTLSSQFNAALENKLVVNFNEVHSDFRKNDSATQMLKSLITDNTFSLNVKRQSEFDAANNFLVILSTNDKNAIKIGLNDRRFNYFTSEKTLKEVAREKFDVSISTYLNEVNIEIESFVTYLSKFNFNADAAQDLLETDSKVRSQKATNSTKDMFFIMIKRKKYSEIISEVDEMIEMFEQGSKRYSEDYVASINYLRNDTFKELLAAAFDKDCILNNQLKALYSVLVQDKEDTDRKDAKILNDVFGKTVTKRIAGSVHRARQLY